MSKSTTRRRGSQRSGEPRLLSPPAIADRTLTNLPIRPFYPSPEGEIPYPTSRRKNFCVGALVRRRRAGLLVLADARYNKYRASLHAPGNAVKTTGATTLRRTLPETENERPVLLVLPQYQGSSQLLNGSTRVLNVRGIAREAREWPAIAAMPRPYDPATADLGGGQSSTALPGWDKHHARGRLVAAISGMAPSRVRR